MKILLVKMSSMGDIFHTFPAITDIKTHYPNAEIHWLVEENFVEIAAWHPGVVKIIPVSLRRWMKHKSRESWKEFLAWRRELKQEHYDVIIDAQGLLKSGLLAKIARGSVHGFDTSSAREPINTWFTDKQHTVSKDIHAVSRTRQLCAHTLNYTIDDNLNFGIDQHFSHVEKTPKKLMFIVGTSWVTKLWAVQEWIALANLAAQHGFTVEVMWGSESEMAVAQTIVDACPNASRPLERMSITAVAEKLIGAVGVVGLDTGFSHLAGALEIPTIAIYGPTSPLKVGLIGQHTANLQFAPPLDCMPCHKRQCKFLPEQSTETPACMKNITAQTVWSALNRLLSA